MSNLTLTLPLAVLVFGGLWLWNRLEVDRQIALDREVIGEVYARADETVLASISDDGRRLTTANGVTLDVSGDTWTLEDLAETLGEIHELEEILPELER